MSKFLFTFGLIIFGLSLGYSVQRMVGEQVIRLPLSLDRLRKILLKSAFLFINPVTVVGAIWVIELKDSRLATLPFLGMGAIFLGGLLGLLFSRWLHLERKQTGSLFTCGSFTNLGTLGGLVCYIFLGEIGFGLVYIYRLFEDFIYYTVGFPVAKLFGSAPGEKEGRLSRLKQLAGDAFILVSLSSLLLGGLLNLSGMKRPEFYQTVNSIFIPLGALLLITAIGLAMKITKVRDYLKECLAVSAIKFLIVPAVTTSLAFLIGYREMAGGYVMKVVILLSSMPVAFSALVPPSLYDLDVDLANSCWLFTTSLFMMILPVLYFIIQFV
jgi:predicted permease